MNFSKEIMKVAKSLKASDDFINEFVINELKMTSFLNNLSFDIEQSMKRNNIVGKILKLEERGNNYANIILNVENIGEVNISIAYKLNKLKLRWNSKELKEMSKDFNLSDTIKDVVNTIVKSFLI